MKGERNSWKWASKYGTPFTKCLCIHNISQKNTGSYLGSVHNSSDCIVATVRRDVCPICGDSLEIKSYIPYNFYTAHVQQLSCHRKAWVSCWMSCHVFIRILHMHIQSKSLICKLLSILTFISYSGASALRSLFRN